MAAKDILEHVVERWDDEVSRADTLRERRKLYVTALGLVVVLGVFRIERYVRPDVVPAVPDGFWSGVIQYGLLIATCFFVVGAYFVFSEGTAWGADPTRANERLKLSKTDIRRMREDSESGDVSYLFRARKYIEATSDLELLNRRVARNLSRGGALIGVGYLCVVICACVYSFARVP